MDKGKEDESMRLFVMKRRSLVIGILFFITIIATLVLFTLKLDSISVFSEPSEQHIRDISIVAVEFEGKTKEGEEIEVYRWDPGTIYINKGEKVNLRFFGINGEEHPFIIEGTKIKGTVLKGKETVVPVKIDKEGIYRLVCLAHSDYEHHGPMVAHLIVR